MEYSKAEIYIENPTRPEINYTVINKLKINKSPGKKQRSSRTSKKQRKSSKEWNMENEKHNLGKTNDTRRLECSYTMPNI